MLYHAFRHLIRFSIHEFFSRINILGAAPNSGPVIYVGNHPNVALDSLLIGTTVDRPLWFIAKSVLFQGVAAHFFRAIKMVPIYRSSDAPGEQSRNADSFRAVIEKLAEGEGVVIFPEGTSIGQRQLLPLKTGAARIALSAAQRGGVLSGLRIQPVGITYSEPDRFRSAVTVSYGVPIEVATWAAKVNPDGNNQRAVVTELTQAIDSAIRALIAEVRDPAHLSLVDKIRRVYESLGKDVDDRTRLDLVIKNVEIVAPRDPEFCARISRQIDRYLELSSLLTLPGNVPLQLPTGLKFKCLLPMVFAGWLIFVVPYRIVRHLVRRVKDPESRASAAFLWGLVLFPAWAVVFAGLVSFGLSCGACFLMLLVGAVVVGMVTNRFLLPARVWCIEKIWPSDVSPIKFVTSVRDEIVAELDKKRVV